MKVTILTVGETLLTGETVDTNAAWLSRKLYGMGVRVRRVITVGDRGRAIRDVLAQEWPKSDLLIITGGLGETSDDLTREAVAQYFTRKRSEDRNTVARILQHYGKKVPMTFFHTKFEPVHNSTGHAPGLFCEDASGRALFVVPGVPSEMKTFFHSAIKPHTARRIANRVRAR